MDAVAVVNAHNYASRLEERRITTSNLVSNKTKDKVMTMGKAARNKAKRREKEARKKQSQRRHIETETKKIGNMTVTTWNEDVRVGDTLFDILAKRAEYEDELPPMEGYGFRETNILTGKITDFTFETQEECDKFSAEYFKPENTIKRFLDSVA